MFDTRRPYTHRTRWLFSADARRDVIHSTLRLHPCSLQTRRRSGDEAELNAPVSGGGLLGSPPVELDLVDRPHRPLDVLQAHEALVEAEVVPDGVLQAEERREGSETAPRPGTCSRGETPSTYLPGGRVAPEVGKVPGEPVVDFIQCQLPAGGFEYRLKEIKKKKMCLRPFWIHSLVNIVKL